ncbi:MATE family efflux transporter [Oxalobacter vibrioformis]|uniref:Multidrug-efflux transporter n=1 Tax=Oxalobacter vibrioformis TaxID=933080 RepID=A0A9E9LXF4_9BURK|nr:MATE family efflux transporter [Oxalobacter vibrioformis]WAW10472.1 MATE family efflux transporter [Oxalobacter vibrioformis]
MKNIRLTSSNPTLSIASLAVPILIGLLAAVGNPVLDTIMVARFSSTDLAALAVGASIYVSIFVPLAGMMSSLTPTFGHFYGAGNFREMRDTVKQGIWLALFIAAVGSTLLSFPGALLSLAKAPPELVEKATLYLRVLAFSLPASMCFFVYSTLNNAIARPKMVMAIQVSGLLLKIPLNIVFIFGWFGIPAFGGPGCAMATGLLAWFMLAAAIAILRLDSFYSFLHLFGSGFVWPRWHMLKELLKLGIPMGMNSFIEITSFTFMALFIARIGVDIVAGHQIVANISTVLYMLPLATANATSALVAQCLGAKRLPLARQIAFSGQRLAVCIAIVIAISSWFLRHQIIGAYTSNESIVTTALPLITFVCCYQFFFAFQITSGYILRAYKVVLAPTLLYFLTFWCVGLGGGYILAFDVFHLQPPARITGAGGFWFAYSISVVLQSMSLMTLLKTIQRRTEKKPLKRLKRPEENHCRIRPFCC